VTGDRDTPRTREDEVDRQGLARAVDTRMREIRISQAELARAADIAPSTIRKMQKAQGTDIFGNGVLARVSGGLRWPEDKLQRIFYRMPEQDPVTPSGVDLVTQAIMTQLAPHLAKIDAIDRRLSAVMDAIHHVNTRIDAVLGPPSDVAHSPHSRNSAEAPHSAGPPEPR
jgi:hypothetical protein